jgi:hypothetical protein
MYRWTNWQFRYRKQNLVIQFHFYVELQVRLDKSASYADLHNCLKFKIGTKIIWKLPERNPQNKTNLCEYFKGLFKLQELDQLDVPGTIFGGKH